MSVFRFQETSQTTRLNGDKVLWHLRLREGAISLRGRRLLGCGTKREQKKSSKTEPEKWHHD